MWNLIFWVGIFILGYLIIFFSADIFLDNLKELCIMYNVSPFIVGLLILGIDPEESIASIVAAANGLPYIAVGNVIGNSIIALSLCFAIPAFLYKIEVESVPQFYFILIYISMIFILIAFLVHLGLFIFGILALILYFFYVFRNLRHFSNEGITNIITVEENEENLKVEQMEFKKSSKLKKIVLVIICFVLIFIGGELLIIATEELIVITQIPEAFFGFVIIAFVTNVEELTLVFKSIKKQTIEIGFGGMIGKLIWNLTITFGISGIIVMNIDFTWILIWNWLILFGIIIYFNIISKKKFIGRKDGIILMFFFVTFIVVNLLTFGLI